MNVTGKGGAGGNLRVTLNGEVTEVASGTTIGKLLERVVRDRSRIAVERNREIVPRALYDTTVVAKDDVIEVVSIVGGG